MGSNLGDSQKIILEAWAHLGNEQQIQTIQLSSLYKTEPIDMAHDSSWFINCAGVISTTLSPEDLLNTLLQVEHIFGRMRDDAKQGYQNRTLDLDLLLYNQATIQSQTLQVPHPRMHERGFVLVPLAEISHDAVHPTTKKNIHTLLHELPLDLAQQIEKM
jgi:2-amino-4-hydroxy-6-hydroxymethyldihydropteridine diphosphokinase